MINVKESFTDEIIILEVIYYHLNIGYGKFVLYVTNLTEKQQK